MRDPLKRDVEVHDFQLMLDERPAGIAVLAAPFDVGEVDAIALDQKPGAPLTAFVDVCLSG